ncbi:MAG: hypothetical protein KC546_15825 [Anaerolineae bacterium]|nr:hypothetical protein [Anaerolineae bacterium]MCA9889849.1 hypothetical protein [Anaerolineae bacterium]
MEKPMDDVAQTSPEATAEGGHSSEHNDEYNETLYERYGVPRGAVAFVVVIFFFYIGYFFLTWYEVFVARTLGG